MKVSLKIKFKNSVEERSLEWGHQVIIGRSSQANWKIEDDKISGKHCRIYLKKDRLEITDLDSKNGVYLNGIRIEQSEMFVGDEVKMGDALITLEESSVDAEASDFLTFPGPFRDRMNYELKADFTGARIQNQMANRKLSVVPKVNLDESHAREVALRKKIKSKIKLSKQEIRTRHKVTAFGATLVDLLILFTVLFIPVFLVGNFVPASATKIQKIYILLALETLNIAVYLMINHKISKFTVGEKLAGIQKLYLQQ